LPPSSPPLREIPELAELSEPRVALVTGAGGFGGRHLLRALEGSAWSVVGLVRRRPPVELAVPGYRAIEVDLTDTATLRDAVRDAAPDYVFHLAAAVPPQTDQECFAVNVGGTTALLESIVKACPEAAVLIVGSDAQYGPTDPADLPTPEAAPMRPVGAYGTSKVLQEAIALRYAEMAGLRVVCVRPFNYIGPGQSEHFVVSRIAQQIALAEARDDEGVVELGSVQARRDFTDVRDIVDAFIRALLLGSCGAVYNVGSGVAHSIGEVAGLLAGLAAMPTAVRSLPERTRPIDVAITTCDASLLRRDTGWAPTIALEKTLADTLMYWRGITGVGGRAPDVLSQARST
jgi:GDP-4-dehydro-6-deoxy-D-mannose reductase